MQIGNVILPNKSVFLAPMEDVTDPSFRYVCKHFGADMVYTEFVSADALIRDAQKSLRKLEIEDEERPIGIQLYGHLIDAMVEAAVIAQTARPDVIDINFGCPVRKIATRGAGAGMLQNIPLMEQMTRAIVKAVNVPVTVKTRLGWDEDSKIIVDVAERLQDCGIAAITIHGRTRAQLYKGEADWTLIGEVKNNSRMKIPVIGNGDVDSGEKAKQMFDRYGVDAIMVGRATYGRPWIFAQIKHYLETGEQMQEMTVLQKVELAKLHFRKSLEYKGAPVGIFEMRRHLSNYFKGLPNFKETRIKLVTSLDVNEIFSLLDKIAIDYPDIQ
jgi:nifR3 family TIM-barrel protein